MTAVLLATYVDDSLRVYLRDDDGQLRQLSQSATVGYLPDPVRLATLVSDLAGELGWSRNGAAAVDAAKVLSPSAVAVAAAEPVKQRRRRRERSANYDRRAAMAAAAAKRERIVEWVREAGRPVSVAELAENVVGREAVSNGALYSMLATCVRQGLLVRSGDAGAYRWSVP